MVSDQTICALQNFQFINWKKDICLCFCTVDRPKTDEKKDEEKKAKKAKKSKAAKKIKKATLAKKIKKAKEDEKDKEQN